MRCEAMPRGALRCSRAWCWAPYSTLARSKDWMWIGENRWPHSWTSQRSSPRSSLIKKLEEALTVDKKNTPHTGLPFPVPESLESAKGAGGKGARVINCHNFFFTPDRETRRIDHTTTEGTAERKLRQFATPAPFTPALFRPFWPKA